MQCTIMGAPRFYHEVCEAYNLFDANDITVLLPSKSALESMEAYMCFDMELHEMSKPGGLSAIARQRLDEHLDATKRFDFLYVVNPHNDFSDMQTFVAGYAHALGKSIFSRCRVENSVARAYVKTYSPQELVEFLKTQPKEKR